MTKCSHSVQRSTALRFNSHFPG